MVDDHDGLIESHACFDNFPGDLRGQRRVRGWRVCVSDILALNILTGDLLRAGLFAMLPSFMVLNLDDLAKLSSIATECVECRFVVCSRIDGV